MLSQVCLPEYVGLLFLDFKHETKDQLFYCSYKFFYTPFILISWAHLELISLISWATVLKSRSPNWNYSGISIQAVSFNQFKIYFDFCSTNTVHKQAKPCPSVPCYSWRASPWSSCHLAGNHHQLMSIPSLDLGHLPQLT